MPKPKASHMPGGAPIKGAKKRATKRKPVERARAKSSKARSAAGSVKPRAKPKPKAKAPCKYGPRTSAGLCPKKPKAAKLATQRVVALASPKSTSAQRKTAARELGHAAVQGVATETIRDLRRSTKTKRGREALKKAALAAIPVIKTLAKRAALPGAVGGALAAGAAIQRGTVERLAQDRVRAVEKKLGKLPPNARATLIEQHRKQAKKDLTIRPSTYGK